MKFVAQFITKLSDLVKCCRYSLIIYCIYMEMVVWWNWIDIDIMDKGCEKKLQFHFLICYSVFQSFADRTGINNPVYLLYSGVFFTESKLLVRNDFIFLYDRRDSFEQQFLEELLPDNWQEGYKPVRRHRIRGLARSEHHYNLGPLQPESMYFNLSAALNW